MKCYPYFKICMVENLVILFSFLKVSVANSILNVAKCNLGKVNLAAMLVSSFPSYTRGGPMPLAGAPRGIYSYLLAVLHKVFSQ